MSALLIISCAETEYNVYEPNVPNGNGDMKFNFLAISGDVDTRAIDNTNKVNSFSVFSSMSEASDYNSTNHYYNWMYNAHIEKNISGGWSYVKPTDEVLAINDEYYFEYWKKDAKHSFFAVAPYSLINDGVSSASFTPEFGKGGGLSLNYSIHQTLLSLGSDIMVASALNKVYGEGDVADGEVDLKFEHALSQIEVRVKLSDEGKNAFEKLIINENFDPTQPESDSNPIMHTPYLNEKVHIHGIGLINVHSSGVMTFKESSVAVGESIVSWKPNDSGDQVKKYTDTEIELLKELYFSNEIDPADAENDLGRDGEIVVVPADVISPLTNAKERHIAVVMPQIVSDDSQFVLAYHQESLNDGMSHDQLVVKELYFPLKSVITEFKPGVKYILEVTFNFMDGEPAISISATIAEWSSQDVSGDINGGYFELTNSERKYKLDNGVNVLQIPFETNYSASEIKVYRYSDDTNTTKEYLTFTLDESSNLGEINYTRNNNLGAKLYDEIYVEFNGAVLMAIPIYYGDFIVGNSFTIPKEDSFIDIPIYSDFDKSLISISTLNGATVTLDISGDGSGNLRYEKPSIGTHDVIEIVVAGAHYLIDIYYGYFTLIISDGAGGVVTPTIESGTYVYGASMGSDVDNIIFTFETNYSESDLIATNIGSLDGYLRLDYSTKSIIYQSTSLSSSADKVFVEVGGDIHRVDISMPSISSVSGLYRFECPSFDVYNIDLNVNGFSDSDITLVDKIVEGINPITIALTGSSGVLSFDYKTTAGLNKMDGVVIQGPGQRTLSVLYELLVY